jgi:hypothetical protein
MRASRQLRLATFATFAALASACSDSTGPSDVQPADLSQVLAELQPSLLPSSVTIVSPVPVPGFSAPVPSSCSYDGASKSFVCPNVTISGVTASRSFTLLDASGAPQTAFDPTTTAAVHMKTTFAGTITSGVTTTVIDQQQDVTVSGLLTGVHTLNGTSLTRVAGSYGTGATTIPINATVSTTITSLVLPRSSSGSPWPQSGTIAATITNAGFGTPLTSIVTITFNGTSRATMTVTVDGFTSTSTIDLGNPGPVRG